jgi:hypothetical protein
VVKICLHGHCTSIRLMPKNGLPVRCSVLIELNHDIPLTYPVHQIQLFMPTEFATLLEVGLPLTVTIDQTIA